MYSGEEQSSFETARKGWSPSREENLGYSVKSSSSIFIRRERGSVAGVEHVIDTRDSPPIRQAPHLVPFALRHKISEMLQQMMKQGIVEESSSLWANPVVIVKKKDISFRLSPSECNKKRCVCLTSY